MAAQRKPRIVVFKDDVSAADVTQDQVVSARGGANVMDAVETMAGDLVPDEESALVNEDIGVATVSLTDSEAATVAKKVGVEAVEEDEEVFALTDGGMPPMGDEFGDSGVLNDEVAADEESAAELAEEQARMEAAAELSDSDLQATADYAAGTPVPFGDDIEFDDFGHAYSLGAGDDPGVTVAADSLGIPRDKIAKLIRCILKCAVSELAGSGAAEIDENQITALLARHGVAGDPTAVQAIRDYITCGLRIIYAPQAWRYGTGAGVRVAVVDTGIAPRHRDLRVYGGVSYVPGVRSWADDQGHGTHVAGTIAALRNNTGVIGVAPHARLYAVKVLNRQGRGYTSWILNGLTWCYRANMHIVNLSLGGLSTTHDPGTYSRAYERAGRLLRRKGILPVAAAGNSGATSRPYVGNPARCPSFMAVAAVDCNRRRARFSSYGPQVEISGPGVGVWSTYPPNGYRKLSGTSMAAPHVAGVAALVKRRRPALHGDRIRVHLWRTAMDLGAAGRDPLYGYGLVNAFRAVR